MKVKKDTKLVDKDFVSKMKIWVLGIMVDGSLSFYKIVTCMSGF